MGSGDTSTKTDNSFNIIIMKRIVLISCTKSKNESAKERPLPAKDLYTGAIFKKAYQYAKQRLKPNKIYILSAKYGLLKPNQEVCYYNETLKDKSSQERRLWADKVLGQLKKEEHNLEQHEFIILAGQTYYSDLTGPANSGKISRYETPYEGKRIGEILRFLNANINNEFNE